MGGFRPGIEAAWLYRAGPDGPAAALLRYAPGAAGPHHRHQGWEHIFVLAGSQADQHASYPAGSFVANPPGTEHHVVSQDGCLALLVWERPPTFLEVGTA